MAIRASRFPIPSAAALAVVAIVATGFAAPAPAVADEDPHYRAPVRQRVQPQRVRTAHTGPVQRVRTVVRVRTRVVCYDYGGQPFDCRNPAPVTPQLVYQSRGGCAPTIGPRYYGSGCCAPQGVVPYGWSAGYQYQGHRYRYAHYR